MEITVVLSGDPRRAALCERVADWYKNIAIAKEVILLYERNPAIAFNKGATVAKCNIIFCAGGDVIVKPSTLSKMASEVKEGEVLFLVPEKLGVRRRFCSKAVLFVCARPQ